MRKKPKKTNKKCESIPDGTEFGHWKVITKADKIDYLVCKCKCGVLRNVNVYSLTSGKSKSCGCSSIKIMKATIKRRNPNG